MQGVEDTRRRMLSDLAHELRTPIATLSAYHEGLHDGVVTLGDDSRMALTAQTERLARLAEDINEVSTAEEGHLALDIQRHKVADLLWAAYGGMRDSYSEKGLNLVLEVDEATASTTRPRWPRPPSVSRWAPAVPPPQSSPQTLPSPATTCGCCHKPSHMPAADERS